jgi:hypothetical protein
MLSIHGVAVAGGNFPATIWHLFMLKATYRLPALTFPPPSVYPTYGDFTRGHYGYSYASSTPSYTPSTSSATGTSTARGQAPPPPTHVAPPPTTVPAPPPPTEPPPTTAPPPPPPTP